MARAMATLDVAWRWLRQPWTEFGVILPVIATLALPPLLVSAGARFEQAVSDSVATQVVDGFTTESLGLTVTVNGRLRGEDVAPAITLTSQRLRSVAQLGAQTRTLVTGRGRGVVLDGDAAPVRQIIASSRLFARAGAIESLDLLDRDPSIRGVYVSEDLAVRTGATTGSLIDVELDGFGALVEIEGIYRNLWPNPPGYWSDVPRALVPRFSTVFNTPQFELLILREDQLVDLGLPAVLRIDAGVSDVPTSLAELEQLDRRMRAVERDLARDAELVEALQGFAGLGDPTPAVASSTPEALMAVRTAVGRLDRPLLTAQAAGLGLGLLVVAAAAVFTIRQQSIQIRLMVREGRGALWIGAVSLAQYALPCLAGMFVGLGFSRIVTATLVGTDAPVPPNWAVIGPATVGGLVVLATVRGAVAARITDQSDSRAGGIPFGFVLLLIGATAAAWLQAGRSDNPGDLDPLVLAFPVLALSASLGVALKGARWSVSRAQRATRRLHPALLFAVRRIGHAGAGVLGLAGALGVAVGIVVFATVVSDTQGVSSESKLATRIGGESSAVLRSGIRDVNRLPAATTPIYTWSTRLTPGGAQVNVVGLEPATFADVVDWPATFGRPAPEVVAILQDGPSDPTRADPLRAVSLSGQPLPGRGAVGSVATYGYQVVDEVESFPLATGRTPSILIDATALERAGRLRWEADLRREFGQDTDPADFEEQYVSPLRNFRVRVVSSLPADALAARLAESGITVRDLTSRSDLSSSVDEQSSRWAFAYLRFVGVVGLVATLGAVVLATSGRAPHSRLRAQMAAPTGVPRWVSVTAAAFEGVALSAVALLFGVATALVVSRRVGAQFDPLDDVPPSVGLAVSLPTLGTLVFGLLAVVCVINLVAEWWIAHRETTGG